MAPARYDLAIYRGDSDAWGFSFWTDEAATVPLDLEGWTPRADVRVKAGAPMPMALLDCVWTAPNIITVSITPTESKRLETCGGAWDLEVTSEGGVAVRTLVAGAVTVTADVHALIGED